METYDIINEAAALVDNQLELLQALYLAKQTLADGSSRRVCRCGSCKSHRSITLAWLGTLLGTPEATETAEPEVAVTTAAGQDASLRPDLN
jgi:hypothetical protein